MHRIELFLLLAAGGLALVGGCAPRGGQQSAQAVDPQWAIDCYVRGQMAATSGDEQTALAQLGEAVRADPKLSVAHAAMGDQYRRQQSYELAAVAYDRACQINPYNFRNHYNLGCVQQALAAAAGSTPELQQYLLLAVETYIRALTLKPDDFDANLNLGVCYYQLGKLDRAEECFLAAAKINPAHPHAQTNLGAVYDAQGKLYEAITAYNRSLELDVRQPRVLVNLGRAYAAQQRYNLAISTYAKAAELDPTSTIPLERMAYCCYQIQDYDQAKRHYQAAVQVDRRCGDAHRGLGVVYMTQYLLDTSRTDLRDLGLEQWNAALEVNPDQPDLVELVRKYTPHSPPPPL